MSKNTENINVLIVDDNRDLCVSIGESLDQKKITYDYTLNPVNGLHKLKEKKYSVLLVDYRMPQMDGFKFIKEVKKTSRIEKTKIIFMTAHGSMKVGIDALNSGCCDYIVKPFNFDNLLFKIQNLLRFRKKLDQDSKKSERSNIRLKDGFIKTNILKQVFNVVKMIADKDTTILIEGETGTGKEIVARIIHSESNVQKNVFFPINCGILNESTLESELFGHEKGAFTGADTQKIGILEAAKDGTIFFDDIDTASLKIQQKLLRFIENGQFLRIGGNTVIHSNARIIASTSQDLDKMVDENKFRMDLYHRLNIVKIKIPPIRESRDDISSLIDYFIKLYNKKFDKNLVIHSHAKQCLINYKWPGNIRELKNVIQSIVLLNEKDVLIVEDLPEKVVESSNYASKKISFKEIKDKVVKDFEINFLKSILEANNGNISKISKLINLSRTNLIKKINAYKINLSDYKGT